MPIFFGCIISVLARVNSDIQQTMNLAMYTGSSPSAKFSQALRLFPALRLFQSVEYIYSSVPGAAIKCKKYSGITMESFTHGKTVQITLKNSVFNPVTKSALEKRE